MQDLKTRLSQDVYDDMLAPPRIRADVVERARALLDTPRWCRAEEVASRLVDCYVEQRVP
jgi:hypothetical protein